MWDLPEFGILLLECIGTWYRYLVLGIIVFGILCLVVGTWIGRSCHLKVWDNPCLRTHSIIQDIVTPSRYNAFRV